MTLSNFKKAMERADDKTLRKTLQNVQHDPERKEIVEKLLKLPVVKKEVSK